MALDTIRERQLELGPAAFFRVEPELVPGNQVVMRKGFAFAGADRMIDAYTGGDQTSAAFAGVSLAGKKRWDLVVLDASGSVAVITGNEVASGDPQFDGAPGFNLGPALPDQILPAALVLIDEVSPSAPVISEADIIRTAGFLELTRSLYGYFVDKGFFGGAPSGTSDDVSALFAAETPGGGTLVAGVVTSAPFNYTHLVDQNGDEIVHATGARMYGRQTEAASVWTLSYFYLDASGAETAMDPSTDTAGPAPTDLRLVGTPKVFSNNDPSRPLFDSSVARLSDQVVGDIPPASTTVAGKVVLVTDGADVTAGKVPDVTDARVGAVRGRANAGAVTGYEKVLRITGTNGIAASLSQAGGENHFTLDAAGTGKVVQTVASKVTGLVTITGSPTIFDDTIPQTGEGVSFASLVITPQSLSNKIRLSLYVTWGNNGVQGSVFSLFRSGVAAALAAAGAQAFATTQMQTSCVVTEFAVPALSAQTFFAEKHIGTGFTGYINGIPAARRLGGVASTILIAEEIAP